MTITKENKSYLIGGFSLVAILLFLYFFGEIVLPFVYAVFIAYLLNPLIIKIQTKIRNRYLAVTSFLSAVTLVFIMVIFFFGGHIIKDSKRIASSIETFAHENQEEINDLKNRALNFAGEVYKNETVQTQIESLTAASDEENKQNLMSTIGSVYSLFEESGNTEDEEIPEPWSIFFMIIYTLLYTVIILYSYNYFEEYYFKYFKNAKPRNKRLSEILSDFDTIFIDYFRQRTKVVAINIIVLIIAFNLLGLPGAIIIAIIAGVLSYASHYHYLSLPLVGIECWILSVENNTSFFLYFGIILVVYILISILDETVYFDKIMKSVNGMNSAIVMLSFTLWISIFGGFTGTIIALPLTQLILIFVDRMLLNSREKLIKSREL